MDDVMFRTGDILYDPMSRSNILVGFPDNRKMTWTCTTQGRGWETFTDEFLVQLVTEEGWVRYAPV